MYHVLKELFDAADKDGSGELDREEMANLLRGFYRMEGRSSSWVKTLREVDDAIFRYDVDGNGLIDFMEFVQMFSGGQPFTSSLPKHVIADVAVMASERRSTQAMKQFENQKTILYGVDINKAKQEATAQCEGILKEMELRSKELGCQRDGCRQIAQIATTSWGQEVPSHNRAFHSLMLGILSDVCLVL